MPQPALHLLIVREVLDEWRRSPRAAPFDPAAPGATIGFLHGALAPDMGLFPGSDPTVSKLVHAGRSADVARRMLASARTDADRAFAWGWVTHILADAEIHPLIDAAAASLLAADGHAPVDARMRLAAHVRVEVGLDAWLVHRDPGPAPILSGHALDRSRIRLLGDALRSTYAIALDDRRLLSTHRRVTHWYRAYLYLLALVAADHGSGRGMRAWLMQALRRVVARLADVRSPVHGFAHAVAPTEDLLDRVRIGRVRFALAFRQHVATRLSELPDLDLETGTPSTALAAHRAPSRRRGFGATTRIVPQPG